MSHRSSASASTDNGMSVQFGPACARRSTLAPWCSEASARPSEP
jgi:hypothetical protein